MTAVHAPAAVDTEHPVFAVTVAETERDLEPPAADQVQPGEVFGQPQRVVQHRDERGEVYPQPAGPAEYRRAQDHRGRTVTVVGAVMFGEVHRVETEIVRPGGVLERRGVLLGTAHSDIGRPHVIA